MFWQIVSLVSFDVSSNAPFDAIFYCLNVTIVEQNKLAECEACDQEAVGRSYLMKHIEGDHERFFIVL